MRLSEAARAIYDAYFTAPPISFDEARRRGALMYRRTMDAAACAQECLAAQREAVAGDADVTFDTI